MSNSIESYNAVADFGAFRRRRQDSGGGDDGGNMIEARIAKLEAGVEHIQADISEIKTDVRDLRRDQQNDFRLLFGALIAGVLGLAALIAKGFHWVP